MELEYIGPRAEVEIASTRQMVQRWHTVRVPDDLGAQLLRDNPSRWRKPLSRATTAKADKEGNKR